MKPSEAIRKGAPLVEENHVVYYAQKEGTMPCGCALGTAYVGEYGIPPLGSFADTTPEDDFETISSALWAAEDAWRTPVECPACEDEGEHIGGDALVSVVAFLHDLHQWSREEIAIWLEGMGL